ncbi:MAG: flagellar basal body-associated FliL family protein [Defluviitaleaceae bacterium]|nr:flagellar basal body-associated FliL family protein [Defluviitaleaceae bacterium]
MDKSKLMMIVIIALLLLLLGTVAGVGFYLIRVADTGEQAPTVATASEIVLPGNMRFISLDSMVANLYPSTSNTQDSVSVEVTIGLNASDSVDKAELDEFFDTFTRGIPFARSIVLNVFVSRTYDQVNTLEGRRETAEIIKNELQNAFGQSGNLIVDVSFSDMIVLKGR